MAEGIWQIIFKHLTDNKIDVYAPSQHIGECKKPYVVLKDGGSVQFNECSSTANTIDVLIYVPKNQFSKIEGYKNKLKQILKEAEKIMMIRSTYFETASFYDEEVKAFMISLQYEVYMKI